MFKLIYFWGIYYSYCRPTKYPPSSKPGPYMPSSSLTPLNTSSHITRFSLRVGSPRSTSGLTPTVPHCLLLFQTVMTVHYHLPPMMTIPHALLQLLPPSLKYHVALPSKPNSQIMNLFLGHLNWNSLINIFKLNNIYIIKLNYYK